METTTQQQDLFAPPEYQIVQASGGKRLGNYIIDLVIFYVLVFVFAFVLALVNPATVETITEDTGFNLLENLLWLLMYGLYMFVIEFLFKGKSLGKLITGTRAVNEDGTNISAKTALLRGLCRAVPFNAFSALGSPSYPWHDKWTNTYVIDEKESNRPSNS